MFYLLGPIFFPNMSLFSELCSWNIPRFFLDFALLKSEQNDKNEIKQTYQNGKIITFISTNVSIISCNNPITAIVNFHYPKIKMFVNFAVI